jgi:hypothetical protein
VLDRRIAMEGGIDILASVDVRELLPALRARRVARA